jgi:hypothetical protein
LLVYKHLIRRRLPQIGLITELIDGAHGRDHRLGMTVFTVSTRPLPYPPDASSTE